MSRKFLVGASAIAGKLIELGLISENDENAEHKVYHWAKTGRIPTGKFGNQLISTSDKLEQVVSKLVS
jgi:hypothetical protein